MLIELHQEIEIEKEEHKTKEGTVREMEIAFEEKFRKAVED